MESYNGLTKMEMIMISVTLLATIISLMEVDTESYISSFIGKALVQWNLSIADTLGTAENILITEVSSFQGYFIHNSI